MVRRRIDLYTSLLILALVTAFLVLSYGLTGKGETVPVLVGWIGFVLCVLDVLAQTDTGLGRRIAMLMSGTAHAVGEGGERPSAKAETVACLWMIGGTVLVILFGFLIATPVYVFAYMLLHGRKGVMQSGLTALVTTLFIWVVFERLMEYELFRGLLFEDL
jgi:hypothetical protein